MNMPILGHWVDYNRPNKNWKGWWDKASKWKNRYPEYNVVGEFGGDFWEGAYFIYRCKAERFIEALKKD